MPAGPEDRGPFYKTPSSGSIFERLRQIIVNLGGTPPEVEQTGPFYRGPKASDMIDALEAVEVEAEEIAGNPGGGGDPLPVQKRTDFLASGTFVVPDDCYEVLVHAIAGGSGG